MSKETMTLMQFLDRPVKRSVTPKKVLLMRIPFGKQTAKIVKWIVH